MSTQGMKLKAIADAIRAQEGSTGLISAKTFADRILDLPVGIENPGIVLPTSSTQEGHLARIAAAIRAKEDSIGAIPANDFASRIAALEPLDAGLEWVGGTITTTTSRYYRDITYGNGRFVIVGGYSADSGGRYSNQYSTTGLSWKSTYTRTSNDVLQSVAYGEGKGFVAVGWIQQSPTVPLIMTNTTGSANAWTARANPSGITTGKVWTGVSHGNDRFVVVSNGLNAIYSETGTSWTLSSMPFSANWRGLTFGNGKFVAVVYGGNQAVSSPDGVNWTVSTLPFAANWVKVVFGAGKFVAIPYGSNQGAYSEDGVTWKAMTLPLSANWQALTFGAGKFVALPYGGNQSIYSYDGVKWKEAALPASRNWTGVAYGTDKFVACAYNSGYSAYAAA